MPEQPLVGRDADPGTVDLTTRGPPLELPGDLADLRDGLRGHRYAEAGEPATRIHREPPADRGFAVAQQFLGLTWCAEAEMLVPVEFECRSQVVHLGDIDVVGADTGLLVRRVADGVHVGA
jgi:hypothetical protein